MHRSSCAWLLHPSPSSLQTQRWIGFPFVGVVSHIHGRYAEGKGDIARTSEFALFQNEVASTHSALTRFLTKSSWPLSSRRVSSIVSSAVIRHCAWLITCCRTSLDFLDACVASLSAIWYRASIHLKSASLCAARDLTMASSSTIRLSVDDGAAPSM